MSGQVVKAPETRHSPAGIPITRFVLQHQSRQLEAGSPREVHFSILVVAAGAELHPVASALVEGQVLRVRGFLTRSSHKSGDNKLVLHAQGIESLSPEGQA